MKKRTTLFIFGIVVFIFFSAQAFAYGPHEKGMGKGGFHHNAREVMEALQLTDAQQDELHALCKVSGEKVAANWKKFEELQASLSEKVLTTSKSSEAGCEEIINQIAELKSRMVKNRLEHWIKFVKILDSDQKEILSGRLKEFKKKRLKQKMHIKRYFPFP